MAKVRRTRKDPDDTDLDQLSPQEEEETQQDSNPGEDPDEEEELEEAASQEDPEEEDESSEDTEEDEESPEDEEEEEVATYSSVEELALAKTEGNYLDHRVYSDRVVVVTRDGHKLTFTEEDL